MVLAQAGDPDEAQSALLDAVSCEQPGDLTDVMLRSRIAVDFVYGGHLDLAATWADNAVDAAELGKGPDRLPAIGWATRSRAQVLEKIRVARAEGPEAARLVAPRLPGSDSPLDTRQWPALSGGCLVWWPEAQYARLVRQVGEVAYFLGARWSDHTAIVESAMRMAAAVSQQPISLVAASVDGFTVFVEARETDPREASTMTACTAFMGTVSKPVRWPPSPRKPCWCGSGRRYRECCGAPRSAGGRNRRAAKRSRSRSSGPASASVPVASAASHSPSSGPNLNPCPDVPQPITTLPILSMMKSSSGVLS